ncbi:MAG: TetR/AcrR family transcriptional regulator, partial [Tissierellia bacterium]|nr:TetR/AcrR family transcriptional regulator [Tissierellia bacterium]
MSESRITKKRKREICMAAKKVFLEKGFKNTTMEDVIAEVGMSKGGVYYYYKSTVDMLIDLCFIGQEVREKINVDFLKSHSEMTQEDILVELTLIKMFQSNDYITLYAMLLEVSATDELAKKECDKMERQQMKDFVKMASESGFEDIIPLINEEFFMLMKSMYVAQLYFDLEDLYMNRSNLFRDIIRNYIRKHKEVSIE